MYARVTRFTGVDAEAMEANIANIEENDGPPEGVPSTGLTVLADKENGTVIMVGFFETEEDLRTGDATLNEMTPPGGALGQRASVDLCEVRLEMKAP